MAAVHTPLPQSTSTTTPAAAASTPIASMISSTVAAEGPPSPTRSSTTSAATATAMPSRPRTISNSGPPLIVRALYDYHSSDSTNLSFQAGTLIRVLTQLQSGWWDGCIDGERGWFPCNFVTEVDGETLG